MADDATPEAALGDVRAGNLVLTGPMGVGKSTVGRILARRLGLRFVDTDTLITEATGQTIPDLFARHGESEFRRLEAEAIQAVSKRTGLVVALGGGAVTNPDNVAALRRSGVVVLLDGSVEALARRVARGVREGWRPLLAGADDVTARLAAIREERAAVYDQAAHVTVDTTGLSAEASAHAVLRALIAFEGHSFEGSSSGESSFDENSSGVGS